MKGYIDTHMHVLTEGFRNAITQAGGDPSGFIIPAWNVESCLKLMDEINSQHAVLSVTSPGPTIAGTGAEGRKLARQLNDEIAAVVDSQPSRLSFFASTPDWTDVEGTLAEIDYIFGVQKKAVGIVVMTSYQDQLLGSKRFKPIWAKLNSYKAIVFIHPTSVEIQPKYIAGFLPQPAIDYPHNTTRTAVDLLLTNRFEECPDIDIILSHAGGSLPFVVSRLTEIVRHLPLPNVNFETYEKNLNRFYYDTALSSASIQLESIVALGAVDRLLFGSDFPYANAPVVKTFTNKLNQYTANSTLGNLINSKNLANNAIRLFEKHGISLPLETESKL